MRELAGRVAVVTGAASGIGLGMATRLAEEGMKVVLADVDEKALDIAGLTLRRQERDVLTVRTDVSHYESVEELARRTVEAYGKVHLVCNNAGVSTANQAPIWQASLADWQWVFGVNFWGVVHGVRAFMPLLLDHGEEAHIVNTASIMGLNPGGGIYGATKHAVVSLSETLFNQLRQAGSRVGVSVLCPGHVPTRITSSLRNRPEDLWDGSGRPTEDELAERDRAWANRGASMPSLQPAEVAEKVVAAVRDGVFYILPHGSDVGIRRRFEAILSRQGPEPLPLGL